MVPCIQHRHSTAAERLMEHIVSEQLQHIPAAIVNRVIRNQADRQTSSLIKTGQLQNLSPVSAHCGAKAYSGLSFMNPVKANSFSVIEAVLGHKLALPNLNRRRSSRPFSYSFRRLLCKASADASAVSSSSATRSAIKVNTSDTVCLPLSSAIIAPQSSPL